MNFKIFHLLFTIASANVVVAQNITLKQSIASANQNGTAIFIAKQSLQTRENLANATKNNYLPKVDVLAGYNHLGDNAQLNIQGEKNNVLNYGSDNITATSGQIYQQITGNQMPSDIQNLIYQTSRNLLSAVYPQGNLDIGKKDYFLAGITVRQPIYLGGKLKTARELANQQVESGRINLENAEDLAAYNTALQYIRILYLNSMIEKQEEMVKAQHKNQTYAENLVKAEILPPYQKNWADIAAKQAETSLENFKLEKENALLTLKSLIGKEDDFIEVSQKLNNNLREISLENITAESADLRLLKSKKTEAETSEKLTSTIGKPNIFAIANAQLFRKDLPIILPPWLVGIEMQWTVFDYEKKSRNLAAKSLVEESDLLIKQKEEAVNLSLKTTKNTLISLKNQVETLDSARKQTYTTTEMVRKRMENSLSSVKDVNDALQLQFEAEKLYYSSLVTYDVALETWFYLQGKPEQITDYID